MQRCSRCKCYLIFLLLSFFFPFTSIFTVFFNVVTVNSCVLLSPYIGGNSYFSSEFYPMKPTFLRFHYQKKNVTSDVLYYHLIVWEQDASLSLHSIRLCVLQYSHDIVVDLIFFSYKKWIWFAISEHPISSVLSCLLEQKNSSFFLPPVWIKNGSQARYRWSPNTDDLNVIFFFFNP